MIDPLTGNHSLHASTIPRERRGRSRARGTSHPRRHSATHSLAQPSPACGQASRVPSQGRFEPNSKAAGPGIPQSWFPAQLHLPWPGFPWAGRQGSCLQVDTDSPRDAHVSGAKCTQVHAHAPTRTYLLHTTLKYHPHILRISPLRTGTDPFLTPRPVFVRNEPPGFVLDDNEDPTTLVHQVQRCLGWRSFALRAAPENHKTVTTSEIIDSDKGNQRMRRRLVRGCWATGWSNPGNPALLSWPQDQPQHHQKWDSQMSPASWGDAVRSFLPLSCQGRHPGCDKGSAAVQGTLAVTGHTRLSQWKLTKTK